MQIKPNMLKYGNFKDPITCINNGISDERLNSAKNTGEKFGNDQHDFC